MVACGDRKVEEKLLCCWRTRTRPPTTQQLLEKAHKLQERSMQRFCLRTNATFEKPWVLHEAGYAFGKTRSWCPTGTAVRKRKAGTVTVHDPKAQEKKR